MVNTTRKCGFRDCQNQIKKQEGYGWQNVCNNCLTKRQWASQCDACSLVNSEEKNFSIINEWENKSSKVVQESEKANSADNKKDVKQLFWIFGIAGIIFIGLVGYFAYRNRKKIKNWQRK